MSFRQLWEGTNNDTFFSRLDGRTKLCVLFLFALIMVIVDNPRTLFILFSISIALHIAAGTPVYKWKVLIWVVGICCQPGIVLCTKSTYSYSYADQSYISCFRCTDRRTLYLSGGNCIWCDTGNEICIYDCIGSACMLDQRSSPAFKRALILASVAANILYAGNSHSIFSCIGL